MNINVNHLMGLKIEVVPTGTLIETEAGAVVIDDQNSASDNSTFWLTESNHQKLLKNLPRCTGSDILQFIKSQNNYAPEMPAQSEIDSWPQLQRMPKLNADEQKYFRQYLQAMEIAP